MSFRPLIACAALALVPACQMEVDASSSAAHESGAPQAADEPQAIVASAQDVAPPAATTEELGEAAGLFALRARTLDGQPASMADYAGKVCLVVNVASRCGYTPQYAGLQQLHETYADRGLVVMGFPSNEFGGQEPGSAQDIASFCEQNFGVTFPMFAKCEVKPGDGQSPVYSYLEEQTGEVPGWNFTKYLVGRDGQVLAVYKSGVAPGSEELTGAIEDALGGA